MVGSYQKLTVCLTCSKKVMKDFYEENAHKHLGHHLYQSYFGGYKEVEERRQPQVIKPEEKIEMDFIEDYEKREEVE